MIAAYFSLVNQNLNKIWQKNLKFKSYLISILKMKPRYRTFKLWFKVRVLLYQESHSINKTAEKFELDRKLVRNWIANKAKIMASNNKSSRTRCERKNSAKFPELEQQLYDWVSDERSEGKLVSGKQIQEKARGLNTDSRFTASCGWLNRFLKRKRLVRRRITTSGRALSLNTAQNIRDFVAQCAEFRVRNFDLRTLVNMDETSIYLDDPSINNTFFNLPFPFIALPHD